MRLAIGREPDFRAALELQGNDAQVLLAEQAGESVGTGSRATREVFINGEPERIGFLSGLRLSPNARGGTGLARGYRFLRELHAAQPVPAYLTTIMADNHEARAVLEGGRAGLPRYRFVGNLTTHALPVQRRRRTIGARGIEVRSAAELGVAETVRWLNAAGRQRQFFPVFNEADFGSPLLRDLELSNVFIALRNGTPVGSMAAWDQSRFKQFHVAGYAPWLAAARPILNLAARLRGAQPLPPPGHALSVVFGAWWLVQPDDADMAAVLLERVLNEAAKTGASFCVVGCMDDDPNVHLFERRRTIALHSRVYLVDWAEGSGLAERLDHRRLHLEAALL
ncbi:MAG: hypothetical protein NTY53_27035 [Kiritimatiellaeota bacterium]|nr:hypothetical protein [Kiritimatiellota bacterium]